MTDKENSGSWLQKLMNWSETMVHKIVVAQLYHELILHRGIIAISLKNRKGMREHIERHLTNEERKTIFESHQLQPPHGL